VLEQINNGTFADAPVDVDALNARFFEANRDLPLAVVQAESWAARTRMLTEFGHLAEVTPAAESWFVESGAEHYAEHLPRLREWLAELAARAPLNRGAGQPKRLGGMGGTVDPLHHGHPVTPGEALRPFGHVEGCFCPPERPRV